MLYAYLGYGALVIVLGRMKGPFGRGETPSLEPYEPSTTLLVAAFNEEAWLEGKIENALSLDYPEEKLKVMVVTDGSDDGSARILEKFSGPFISMRRNGGARWPPSTGP